MRWLIKFPSQRINTFNQSVPCGPDQPCKLAGDPGRIGEVGSITFPMGAATRVGSLSPAGCRQLGWRGSSWSWGRSWVHCSCFWHRREAAAALERTCCSGHLACTASKGNGAQLEVASCVQGFVLHTCLSVTLADVDTMSNGEMYFEVATWVCAVIGRTLNAQKWS